MKGDYRLMEWKKEESKTWLRNRSFVETICLFFLFFLWHFYWFLFWFRRSAWNIISFQKWWSLAFDRMELRSQQRRIFHQVLTCTLVIIIGIHRSKDELNDGPFFTLFLNAGPSIIIVMPGLSFQSSVPGI